MASAAQLDGVAQLQVAKAAATAKIEEARTRRIKKLKQAKSEAAVEANLYKAECEAAIKELEQRSRSIYRTGHSEAPTTLRRKQGDRTRRDHRSGSHRQPRGSSKRQECAVNISGTPYALLMSHNLLVCCLLPAFVIDNANIKPVFLRPASSSQLRGIHSSQKYCNAQQDESQGIRTHHSVNCNGPQIRKKHDAENRF
ncbi:hypothetical protein ECG_00650 [Echinococcus granulosus]|uniref:V-ATPase_G domain containing protein n=1 Tax=Echinococcus granulosus TaxID=6210 RepID=A0A068WFV7_ECHGR|nr:hypothetical protein ECG_00650 [Echinococcus granulosus]CDS16495.1 V-ATPase_G domain containing protein [Echinococcus granulosus]